MARGTRQPRQRNRTRTPTLVVGAMRTESKAAKLSKRLSSVICYSLHCRLRLLPHCLRNADKIESTGFQQTWSVARWPSRYLWVNDNRDAAAWKHSFLVLFSQVRCVFTDTPYRDDASEALMPREEI